MTPELIAAIERLGLLGHTLEDLGFSSVTYLVRGVTRVTFFQEPYHRIVSPFRVLTEIRSSLAPTREYVAPYLTRVNVHAPQQPRDLGAFLAPSNARAFRIFWYGVPSEFSRDKDQPFAWQSTAPMLFTSPEQVEYIAIGSGIPLADIHTIAYYTRQ